MAVTLGATELAALRGFVRDVLETINYDDTGVTADLEDGALRASEILKMSAYVSPVLEESD